MNGQQKSSSNYEALRMDSQSEFEMKPFPLEKEFKLKSIEHRLQDLTREDLETFLMESLSTMARLAHQVQQLNDYVQYLEGKSNQI